MKKLTVFMLLLLFMMPSAVSAKSFSVDRVQIQGWVQPNGDVLVNEVFTYTLDGTFESFKRSFPEQHAKQIRGFNSFIINHPQPIVGELEESVLTRAVDTYKEGKFTTIYNGGDETVSILYTYTLENAVLSYDTYSDLTIEYFDRSANHDQDLKNVTITYVLPGAVGMNSIHGFLSDRQGQKPSVYRDGISFHTPNSAAYTNTRTRVFFPSDIMTDQRKIAAPISFKQALIHEQERNNEMTARFSKLPILNKWVEIVSILFLLLTGIIFLLKQRLFSFVGNTDLVLQTDPTYLTLVDHNGKFNRKNFLSGLFSLEEKGIVKAEMTAAASRFQGVVDAPQTTLVFRLLQSNEQLKKSKKILLSHEQYLVTWLFKGRIGHRRFHLHDLAGPGEKAKRTGYVNVRKQAEFHKNHLHWHKDVVQLMTTAGALSTVIPKVLKTVIIVCIWLATLIGFYLDDLNAWGMVFFTLVIALFFYIHQKDLMKKWPTIALFIALFFGSAQISDAEFDLALLFMIITGAILFYLTPVAIPRSITAFYTKMSIAKFRRQVRRGLPAYLQPDEQERWLVRAYVLNKSKKRLPAIKGAVPDTSPLLPLFALPVDPLHFSYSTWAGKAAGKDGSSYTSSFDGGGGYSDGGDGGGGAGAD